MGFIRSHRLYVLLLLSLIAAVLSGCGGGGSSAPLHTGPFPGYLESCLVDGQFIRWTRMPINVFIDTTTIPANWRQSDQTILQQSLDQWEAASNGTIAFHVISTEVFPCIAVKWVQNHPMGEADAAGAAQLDGATINGRSYVQDVRIEIATTSLQGSPYSDNLMHDTTLHELGHALGLWGHSTNSTDIMFDTQTGMTTISDNDAVTLNALYALPSDVPEVPNGFTGRSRWTVTMP